MSKSQLKNSASKDEINWTEESEVSDDEFNTCLTLQSCNHTFTKLVFQKCLKENCTGVYSASNH